MHLTYSIYKIWKEYSLKLHALVVVDRDAYFDSDSGTNITGSTFPTGQNIGQNIR